MSDAAIGALRGKTALITAGAAAISVAAAELLVRDGAVVVLMGRTLASLEAARDRIAGKYPDARIEVHQGDACVEADVIAAVQAAYGIENRLDVVVSTVGGGSFKPLLMLTPEELLGDLNLNIVSALLAAKHAAPLMRPGSSIVLISSIAAKMPFRYLSSYNTAKAGLEGFVRIAAEELGPRGIRVNAVRPGFTRSAGTAAMFEIPSIVSRTEDECPLGRVGEPEDVAPAIRFLAGPESAWMTGQSFAVDGGNELRKNPDLTDMVEQMFGADTVAALNAPNT